MKKTHEKTTRRLPFGNYHVCLGFSCFVFEECVVFVLVLNSSIVPHQASYQRIDMFKLDPCNKTWISGYSNRLLKLLC